MNHFGVVVDMVLRGGHGVPLNPASSLPPPPRTQHGPDIACCQGNPQPGRCDSASTDRLRAAWDLPSELAAPGRFSFIFIFPVRPPQRPFSGSRRPEDPSWGLMRAFLSLGENPFISAPTWESPGSGIARLHAHLVLTETDGRADLGILFLPYLEELGEGQ